MQRSLYIHKKSKLPPLGAVPLSLIIVGLVFVLAVLQDFIYSKLRDTGFYVSESLLYNTFWVFFIPFTMLINRLIKFINPKNNLGRLPYNLGIAVLFSFLHITLFTALFVLVSHLVFTPPHRFLGMFSTALSNQFYIALFWYVVFPIVYVSRDQTRTRYVSYPKQLKVKIGPKIRFLPIVSIQLITTDKPYSVIYADGQKILDDRSLKQFETKVDPSLFLRVHRSAIVNARCIKTLKSRRNGDYDALLHNGQTIRLSRHYRSNWCHLLH